MKVLHLSSERTWRGGEQQIASLIGVLKSQGVENLVAARAGSAFVERMKGQVEIVELPFASELDLYTAWKIRGLVRERGIDVVHMHSGHGHTLGVLSHRLGHSAALILSKRTDYPVKDNPFSRWKFNYPGIKRILCVSNKIREIVSKDLVDPSKAVTVYSGIDTARFPATPSRDIRDVAGIGKDARVVVSTAAVSPQKDYGTFVKVAEELRHRHPDLHFVVCGEGPSLEEIQDMVKSKGLEGQLHFIGFRKDLPDFLGSADAFLITSKEEGLGTSILDAFAVGLPVVATAAGGIPEIVRHGKTGLLARIGDAPMLATHIENLVYVTGGLRESLILNGRSAVEAFSFRKTGLKTLEIYRS